VKGLKSFILRGNVVDLAVAVVIGAAFGAVVSSLVKNILTPIIAAIGGQPDFSGLTFTINSSQFRYGAFINDVIAFVFIATAVHFFVILPLNKLAERRARGLVAADETPPPSDETVLLAEIRDLLASQARQ